MITIEMSFHIIIESYEQIVVFEMLYSNNQSFVWLVIYQSNRMIHYKSERTGDSMAVHWLLTHQKADIIKHSLKLLKWIVIQNFIDFYVIYYWIVFQFFYKFSSHLQMKYFLPKKSLQLNDCTNVSKQFCPCLCERLNQDFIRKKFDESVFTKWNVWLNFSLKYIHIIRDMFYTFNYFSNNL